MLNRHIRFDTRCAGLDWDVNHVLGYGQSLVTGQECWPTLTEADPDGACFMLGSSVHCCDPNRATRWQAQPCHGPALQPLAATAVDYGGRLLSREEQARLPAGVQHLGETPLESAARFLAQRWIRETRQRILVSSCGVGGKTIEQLSDGATPCYFDRITSAAEAGKAAVEQGQTYGVAAIVFIQGEYNYLGREGGTTDRSTYGAALKKLHRDATAAVMAVTGQHSPPAFVMAQTGAAFTRDEGDLAIGEAQLEFAATTPGVWLAAPYYPVTDKGGHLDSNGARWLGFQFGKVLNQVLLERADWEPLGPRHIGQTGRIVMVDFHVPNPPLLFDTPYDGAVARSWPQKGFAVMDETGDVPIDSVEIDGNAVILRLLRPLAGRATLRYAGQAAFDGNGMLRDSDPTLASEPYLYRPESGQYVSADVPQLVGRPYPLWNWCVAFSRPVEPDASAA